jgi:hypothetical protein
MSWKLVDTMVELRKLPEAIQALDGGDVDGDGTAEVVTLGAARVSLFRLEGERLLFVAAFESKRQGRLLSAQLLRLPGAQPIGVVVNRQIPDGTMDSFVLVLQGQNLVLLHEHLYDILLAMDMDGDGVKESLWGQQFDHRYFFRRGIVRQYTLANGALEVQENLTVPDTFRATGATLAKFDANATRAMVFVDTARHLRVYRSQEELWRSRDPVGGGGPSAELERVIGRDTSTDVFFFEAIPAVVDLDGDGSEEILLGRNAAFLGGLIPNLNQYSGGDVVVVRKEKYGFGLTSISPEFNGFVSGVAVLSGNPRAVLVAVTKKRGILKGADTTVFLSRLP